MRCARDIILLALLLAAPRGASGETASGTLTLEDALRLAREQGEAALIAREEVERARIARDRAWAPLLPSLVASGTFTHADRGIAFGDRVLQLQDSFGGSISARITLLQGGSIGGLLRAGRELAAAEEAGRWSESELLFEVASAYYGAVAADNLLETAERALETAAEHVTAVAARRSAGEAVGVDERRARMEVVSAEEGMVRARVAREGSLDYLAFLVGREPPVRVVRPAETVLPETTDEAAVEARSDLRAAALRVRAAEAGVTEAWMEYLPTLAVTGSYRASQNTGFSGDPYSWQIALTLDWVLYDGGLRRAARRDQDSRLREARLRLERLGRDARREARQALRELEAASATLRTSQERRALAEETRSMVMRQYAGGVATSLEVVDADDGLRRAEVGLVAAELDLAIRHLALLRALGMTPAGTAAEER